jgi:DNA polymerase III subunit delta
MAKVTVQKFDELLQKGKLGPALLLLGDETYLRDSARARIIDKLIPEAARTWAVGRFSADDGDTLAALGQAQTLPMLSPQQVIFLEKAEAIEKLGEKNRDEAVEAIEAYLENPAPFTLLVIEAEALDQRMRLAKMLAEKTLVVDVAAGGDPEARIASAVGLAKELAKQEGFSFEAGAAEELAALVDGDLTRLETEVKKLAAYAADRKSVRAEDVKILVISGKTSNIWQVVDFLASRKPAKALELLDRCLRQGDAPLEMLGAITWMYRKVAEASELRGVTNGWQAARSLSMRPEQAELAIQSARKLPRERLLACIQALQRADDRLKKGGEEPRIVMEFLVTELVGKAA